jgi:hypothetical protein
MATASTFDTISVWAPPVSLAATQGQATGPRNVVGRPENFDSIERPTAVTGPDRPLPWFARASESPSGTLGSSWLASSPFALGIPRALGSSGSEPRGTSRRIPRRSSPALPRHPSGLALPLVASHRGARPTLPPPRSSSHRSTALQHMRKEEPFLSLSLRPSVRTALPCHPKDPSSGFGYPLDGVSPSILGSLFQLPTLLGFPLQGVVPIPRPTPGFPGDLPLLRFFVKPNGLTPALQRFSLVEPAAPPALPPSSGGNGDLALLRLSASRVFLHWTFAGVSSSHVPLSPFPSGSEEPERPGLRGFLPAARHLPPLEGR